MKRICNYCDMTEPDHWRGVGISFSYFLLFKSLLYQPPSSSPKDFMGGQ